VRLGEDHHPCQVAVKLGLQNTVAGISTIRSISLRMISPCSAR
jgi:hypothetical protein